MKREQNIQKLIMLALTEAGCIVWRNNIGSYTTAEGHFIRYGVGGVGGSDLIGIYKKTGQLIAVEVKGPKGKPSAAQLNFIEQVRAAGGIAGLARSVQEALDLLPR